MVILITIIYAWSFLKFLPEYIMVPENRIGVNFTRINKNVIWDDIRLMVITYLVSSLLCIYM